MNKTLKNVLNATIVLAMLAGGTTLYAHAETSEDEAPNTMMQNDEGSMMNMMAMMEQMNDMMANCNAMMETMAKKGMDMPAMEESSSESDG